MSFTDPLDYILKHLRDRDREEIAECGHPHQLIDEAFRRATFMQVWASPITHKPACVIAFAEQTPKTLVAAMLATDDWPHVVRDVLKAVPQIKEHLLRKGYVRAECRTMEGHDAAVTFLERLGFRLEARIPSYGKTGKAFRQYAWTLDDHSLGATPLGE
jgi:hypothetical protein